MVSEYPVCLDGVGLSCIGLVGYELRGAAQDITRDELGDEVKVPRRKWVHTEDVALVNALYEMVINGGYKPDNGFKLGFLTHLEQAIRDVCPDSGIRAKPHIESRLKYLKTGRGIVNDMIQVIKDGSSGFGFDSTSSMIIASDDVWEDYLKNFPTAKDWRNKSFPHYEKCCFIFGNDRVTGEDTRGPDDVLGDGDDTDSSTESETKTTP
ncbi:hypothetical protein Sjap_008503 [Stephania japonica]|uniref:Myb/SANT-like domain-containing protein n=1 Tax=Stephania japonica TaxID=461633 RepID=A0AAP0JQ40_9MAGN